MADIVTSSIAGEEYTHRTLWRCVAKQLEVARANPQGSWYFHLTAMLMGYLVFEAYLNYLGAKVAADTWATEREFFSKLPYRGSEGKLKKILELHGMSYPDKNVRPFASVVFLASLRDEIVHAKLHRDEFTRQHSVHAPAPRMKYWLEDKVNESQAERTLADVDSYLEALHASVVEQVGKGVLTPFALKGSTILASGSTYAS